MDIRYDFGGAPDKNVRFVVENQLMNRESWKKFAEVYETREDTPDNGWRGEYFGKMMRGACMTYEYTKDEELFKVLTEAVCLMLEKQDELGRFSTYTVEREFNGWDMWSRKYIMVGMEFYCRIAKDEQLKKRIIEAVKRHADYIISKIGPGKIDILDTSNIWGCVNSCTILEPMVELYKMTGEPRYKEFAEYIISTGGCKDGNIIEHAEKQDRMPYEYEEVKAYETMSFFEGLLAYYEVTGEKRYLDIVRKFADNVYDTDITIIGCSGCTHELFDHSKLRQTEPGEGKGIMQETCVTVTWMRLCDRLYRITGDAKYMDRIEVSALNALYGSINKKMLKQYSFELKTIVDPMAFDSYSPLYSSKRGKGVGGFKIFRSGGYFGCCACIASAGTALYPLDAVYVKSNDVYVNFFIPGTVSAKLCDGSDVAVTVETDYPSSDDIKITIKGAPANVYVRVPEYAGKTRFSVPVTVQNGYAKITGAYSEISFNLGFTVKTENINGKHAYKYGPIVLCLDQAKNGGKPDFGEPVQIKDSELQREIAIGDETVRFAAPFEGNKLVFTDYASCGQNWTTENLISVWMAD